MAAMKPLFAHQKESLKFMATRNRVFDMSDPGTAKTRVELEDFKRNRERGKAMIVIAPKSILQNAWGDDAAEFTPDLKVSVAYAENRAEAFMTPADVYVTNTDAVKWLVAQGDKKFWKRFERIVIDESSAFKHHTSDRSRALERIKKFFEIRRCMTGTPNSRSITDIWNQAYFLDDGKRLGQQFYAFRAATCVPVQKGRRKEMVEWQDKPGAEEAVASMLSDITIRHKFEDCIDIPPTFKHVVKFYPTKKQRGAYESMERDAIALMNKGMVSAVNAAACRTKMLQIASGAVYENSHKYHVIDDSRYELVVDLVEERKHSIVFYLWKHQRDEIVRMAQARKITYCVFDGEASDKQRQLMKQQFQAGFFQMMIAHPKSAAHGLTLTRAQAAIWPSPPDDLEWWVQANRRHARAGQQFETEIIAILAQKTIEPGVYRKLEVKQARMDNLLELME
jgi:SNF2 family DNA or RNA helicase